MKTDYAGNLVARYVYGTKINVPDYVIKEDTTLAVITDHLGSVRMLVNTANGDIVQRIDYDAFGNILLDNNSGYQPFYFAGGLYELSTGLIRFGARDFDPVTARWNTKDPLLFGAGQANLFMYCGNDPINRLDPSGLQDFMCINAGEDFWEWLQKALGIGGDPSGNDPTFNDRPYAGVDENVARFQYDAFGIYIYANQTASILTAEFMGAYLLGGINFTSLVNRGLYYAFRPGSFLNSGQYIRIGFYKYQGQWTFRGGGKVFSWMGFNNGKWNSRWTLGPVHNSFRSYFFRP